MIALRQVARRGLHAGALIFGAWWLVATSAPAPGPARDCFTGIGDPTRLQVTLGSTLPTKYAADVPSCGALDGLTSGSILTFDLSQGPRPASANACYGYDTDALTGVSGVAPKDYGLTLQQAQFTSAYGSFALPAQTACRGDWYLFFSPETAPPPDELISPLDAGAQQRWIIDRRIGLEQAQFCGAGFTQTGAIGCSDVFEVASITELPAP